jgi:hypothetical protein
VNFFRLLPVILSFLLLGAHFYRSGLISIAVLCAMLPLLLFIRHAWVPRLFQALLLLGALEWLRTLYLLASMRVAFEQPWGRLTLILGGVAAFTALSGLVFSTRTLRRRFGNDSVDSDLR